MQRLGETTLILTEFSNHYQPSYSHPKTDGSNCAFWDLQQHCFSRKCLSILTLASLQLCNLFARECNSTEVTKNRNGRLATKRIGMAICHKKNRNGHLPPFNRFGIGLQYTNIIISNALLRIGGTRYMKLCNAIVYGLSSSIQYWQYLVYYQYWIDCAVYYLWE